MFPRWLQALKERNEAPAEQNGMLELYRLRDLLRDEQKLREAAEAAPRIAERRLLEAEERAAAAEALTKEAEQGKQAAILECRKDRSVCQGFPSRKQKERPPGALGA